MTKQKDENVNDKANSNRKEHMLKDKELYLRAGGQ